MYVEGALMQIRLEGDETRDVTLRAALVLSHAPSRFSLRRLALRYNFPLTFLPPWLTGSLLPFPLPTVHHSCGGPGSRAAWMSPGLLPAGCSDSASLGR